MTSSVIMQRRIFILLQGPGAFSMFGMRASELAVKLNKPLAEVQVALDQLTAQNRVAKDNTHYFPITTKSGRRERFKIPLDFEAIMGEDGEKKRKSRRGKKRTRRGSKVTAHTKGSKNVKKEEH